MEEEFDYNSSGVGSDQEVDNEVDEKKHSKLLDAISSLDGKKRLGASQRTLPARQISEFNFSASGGLGKVRLSELVGTLKEETSHGTLKKQLQSVEKRTKVVPTPLPKPEQQRIQRSLAYETTTEEVSKWDSIVHKNRQAEQLRFPLEQPDLKVLTTTDAFIKRFQPRTPLEKEIAILLHGSDSVLNKTQILTAAEERALKAMNVEEAKMRRAELQKYRALLSYKESKSRWQKKIKSKRYHKHMRKSRQKEELKSIEELKKNDPEAYQEKMRQIEKDRIEERMNLKHRGGSKFIQKQKIYSKYQDQARQAVQDMYQKSRELTQKTGVESDSDKESGVSMESDDELKMVDSDKGNNPWMSINPGRKIRIKTVEDLEKEAESELKLYEPADEDFIHIGIENDSEMKEADLTLKESAEQFVHLKNQQSKNSVQQKQKRKKKKSAPTNAKDDKHDSVETEKDTNQELDEMFENLENESVKKRIHIENKKDRKRKKKKKSNKNVSKNSFVKKKAVAVKDENEEISEEEDEEIIQESLTKKSKYEDFENDSDSNESLEGDRPTLKMKKQNDTESSKTKENKSAEVYVDPKKLFALDTTIRSRALPDVVVNDDEDITETDQRMTIAEAFADDDVIEEFTQDKATAKKKDNISDIDLTLPGWGEWGGSGIKLNERKRRRFTIKAPPGPPRKDRLLGHVIINEQKDKAIAKHQVSHLPFPYTSIQQFEQSVRAPVGKNWNPETAFKLLTKPKVVTRLGTVIKPINKSQVFKKDNTNKADITFNDNHKNKKKFLSRKKKQKKKGNL